MELIELVSNYGVIGLLFAFAIDKFFLYLKQKKSVDNNFTDEKQNSIINKLGIDVARIDERTKAIEQNHFPHLEAKVDKLSDRFDVLETRIGEFIIQQTEIMLTRKR